MNGYLFLAEGVSAVALVQLILVLASVGSAIGGTIYSYQKAKKGRGIAPQDDFALSNTATQGSFVPLVIGRRRIGSVMAWVGDRWAKPPRRSKALAWLYEERSWQLLCVGPAKKLHAIWANGEQIFPDPNSAYTTALDSTSNPSGSLIQIYRGDFRIYWGEPDQPVNTFLADAGRVGIASRWPHMCYVVWERYGLEFQPIWPQIEYEIEVDPYITAVPDAAAVIDPIHTATGYYGPNAGYALAQVLFESYPHGAGLSEELVRIDYTPGGSGGGVEVLSRIHILPTTIYTNGNQTFLGNAAGTPSSTDAGTYNLTHNPPFYSGGSMEDGNNWAGIYLVDGYESGYINELRVYLRGPSAQQVEVYNSGVLGDFYDGSDIYSWMPPGSWQLDTDLMLAFIELDLTKVTLDETGVWDLYVSLDVTFDNNPNERLDATAQITLTTQATPNSGSLYDLFSLMDTEGQTASVYAENGEEAGAIVSQLMTDAGVLLPIMCDGTMGVSPIRQVDANDVIQLDEDQILHPRAEINVNHADNPVDRALYSFSDLDRKYRQSVIQIDEDGQPARSNNVKGSVVQLLTVVDFEVAATVAERRSQEDLSQKATYEVLVARGGHRIQPGKVINVPGIADYLRVVSVQLSDTSDKAVVVCVNDFYGVAAASYRQPAYDNGQVVTIIASANLQATFFELPEFLGTRGVIQVVPLRIRDGLQNTQQIVHFSSDGTSYSVIDSTFRVMSGGVIAAGHAMAADDPWEIEQGPQITLVGDADDLTEAFTDLTSTPSLWRRGVQLALIGEELFFVRKITALGGTSYRLDGLLRARYDTERAAHADAAEVFLFTVYDLEGFTGPEISPGEDLYLKQQPFAATSPLALASVTATTKGIAGKGVVPMAPGALEVTAPYLGVPAYSTGEDVSFRWAYRSGELAGTGAGLQPAGSAVGVSAIRGSFEIEVYDTVDTLQATYTVTVPTWTYANATLQTDLGSEASFYILVRNTNGGWKSPAIRIDVEKL